MGVPVYNWAPSYLEQIKAAEAGTFTSQFIWAPPDWKDLNNPDTSAVGFYPGQAMTAENQKSLDDFIAKLGDGSVNLYTGPLKFQDGTDFLKAGETATPQQIWYMTQLLEGIEGPSQ